jgi:hypothetical protein
MAYYIYSIPIPATETCLAGTGGCGEQTLGWRQYARLPMGLEDPWGAYPLQAMYSVSIEMLLFFEEVDCSSLFQFANLSLTRFSQQMHAGSRRSPPEEVHRRVWSVCLACTL